MIKKDEANTGVPREKVIVGGFQMGGAMALHLGYKFNTNIAGVFALSSFLPPDSLLYDVCIDIFTIAWKNYVSNLKIKLGNGYAYFYEVIRNAL